MKNAWSLLIFSLLLAQASPGAPQPGAFVPTVLSIRNDSITIQSRGKAGLKVTDIDSNGSRTVHAPDNVQTFGINQFTTITVDGLGGDTNDIKAGMAVTVTQGTDPQVASTIVAYTIPPPWPAATPPKVAPAANTRQAIKAFHKIEEPLVLSVGIDRITVGQRGSDKARAYRVTAFTEILIDGSSGRLDEIRPGMNVRVSASDEGVADRIETQTASDNSGGSNP